MKEKKADEKIESNWGLEGKAIIKLRGRKSFSEEMTLELRKIVMGRAREKVGSRLMAKC